MRRRPFGVAWTREYKQAPDAFANGLLSEALGHLQDWFVREGIREYWVHDSLSHVDFIAFCYLDAAFSNQFERRPHIQAYLASENRPAVFGMGLHGPKVDPDARLKSGQLFYEHVRSAHAERELSVL
jgi:glutathione S-transferase